MTHIIFKTQQEAQTMLEDAIQLSLTKPTFLNFRVVKQIKTLIKDQEVFMSPGVKYRIKS